MAIGIPLLKRNTRIIYRYILIEFLKWFGLSFAFFFAAFFINNILLLAKDILSKRAPLLQVLNLLFYTFPTIFSYSFPFSVLLATIVTMVQFNTHHELLAMQAAGISLARCYLPIMVFSLFLTVGAFYINDYLLPRSSVQFVRLYQEILFSVPGLELEPYSIRKYENNIIVTQQVDRTKIFNPLIIQSNADDNQRRIITSDTARLEVNQKIGVLSLILDRAQGHSHEASDFSAYDYFSAESLAYNVLLFALNISLRPPTARELNAVTVKKHLDTERDRVEAERSDWNWSRDRERLNFAQYYLDSIYRIANDPTSVASVTEDLRIKHEQIRAQENDQFLDQEYRLYQTEYYRKFSLPAACFFLTLFAFPVGAGLRRANWSIGFGVGLIASVVFWCLLIGGQVVAIQRANLSPFVVMFLPNIVMIIGGAIIIISRKLKRT